jgi:hypothetical protein
MGKHQRPTKDDLTVVYYTSNFLEGTNPYFLENTKKQLLNAIGDLPLIVVSQLPMLPDDPFLKKAGEPQLNICVGDIGRSHLNIYKQILTGARAVKTPFFATAEDDILYSYEHFHTKVPRGDYFLYDMNRISLFTWNRPPIFSYRHKRMVINQLIAPTDLYIKAFEERFAKYPDDDKIPLYHFSEPGRYENHLGVTIQKTDTFMCKKSSIVFTHQEAYGYMFNHGERKALGDLRIFELYGWPRPEELLKLYFKPEDWGKI